MGTVMDQITAFLLLILLGILTGLLFDSYRTLRRLWKPSRLGTMLGDLAYWLIVTPVAMLFLVFSTWGELRLYVFLAIGSGLVIYLQYLSKPLRPRILQTWLVIGRILCFISKLVLVPARIIVQVLLLPFRLAGVLGYLIYKGLVRLLKIMIGPLKKIRAARPPEPPPENNCPP